jgi:hypothetical protein
MSVLGLLDDQDDQRGKYILKNRLPQGCVLVQLEMETSVAH